MAQPEPLSVDDALDRLVNQFSDAMACFRELIQNALDAGSDEVEVWFEHDRGMMTIHVDDWGAGMNREIIDTRLTRLFSSTKDGDMTKIGKFGIGFVSVFAIQPAAVSIDTSRDGEHWRVVFDERRRFSLVRRDQPVEGTKISIFKHATKSEYELFRARAAEVVRYWCKHVSGEVRVDGELINEAIDLDTPCKVRREQDNEIIVVGHPLDGEGFSGFYNRGLTLVEGRGEHAIPGVAFKASSAKLEHTLTRDDVIRDARFNRLMTAVQELIAGELCAQVYAKLDVAIRDATSESSALEYLWAAARLHEQATHAVPEPDHAALFRSPSGAMIGWKALRKPKRRAVILARALSPLTERLEGEGATVVLLAKDCVCGAALLEAIAPRVAKIEDYCTALPPRSSDEAVRWQVLASQVARLLEAWGAKLGGVRLGHLDYPDSAVRDRVAITQSEFGEVTPTSDTAELGTGLLASRRVVVLNADHPSIRTIAGLAQSEPELAAYLAVKAFFLGTRLDAKIDEALAVLTHDHRLLRRGAQA
ncbi:sacsin N-terminal ATP-binding-like domain-containing protein [Enhygromyxa salina]|uniref:Chaperone protein HtpG n=1 Tax=Enhygromyxa salina TaxID=215803 RepID=A0A2S9XQL2_9BACT|nr:ATP-binding protein [Enhygromyxa salina]PRP95157.1 Chaperone protein HtpG [Enhygromyxa salina]